LELEEFYRDENGFWRLRRSAKRRKYAPIRRPLPARHHAPARSSEA